LLLQAVANSLVQKAIPDRRARLALRALKAFRACLGLRDSKARKVLRAHKGRRVILDPPAPPFGRCKLTARSIATLARHWFRYFAQAGAPLTERSAAQCQL
jgi:hypothetical protein